MTAEILSTVAWVIAGVGGAAGIATLVTAFAKSWSPQPRTPRVGEFLHLGGTLKSGDLLVSGTGALKARTRVAVWQLGGADHTAVGAGAKQQLMLQRIGALNRMADTGVNYTFITSRRRESTTADHHESGLHAVDSVMRRWNDHVATNTLRTEHYCIASKPPAMGKATAWAQVDEVFRNGWREYQPVRLKTTATMEKSDEATPHPAQPLADLLSPLGRPRLHRTLGHGQPTEDLTAALATDILQKTSDGVWGYRNGNEFGAMAIIAVQALPDFVSQTVIEQLQQLPVELTIAQQLRATNRAVAIGRWVATNTRNSKVSLFGKAAARDCAQAAAALAGETDTVPASVWEYSLTVLVYGRGDSPESAKEATDGAAAMAERVLSDAGYTVIRNGPGANAAWWDIWPGPPRDPRPWKMLSHSIATNLALESTQTGVEDHDWAPRCVVRFPLINGAPYSFTFHPTGRRQAAGHLVVIGPTGKGKTTMLLHWMYATLGIRDARIAVFDRLNGCEIAIKAAGGRYVTFASDDPDAETLNPMQLPNSAENRAFLRSWLEQMASDPSRPETTLTPTGLEEVANCVSWACQMFPPEERSLAIMHRLAFHPEGRAFANLKKWVDPEQLGSIFNSERDSLPAMDARQRLLGFDCTDALKNDTLAPPLVSYLMHRVRDSAKSSGAPHLVIIDETEPMLRNSEFKRFYEEGLKEGRKLRTVYVSCFQDPEAIKRVGMESIVDGQCPTVVLLQNPRAKREHYASFELTDAQFDFVRGRGTFGGRYAALVVRSEGESAILNTDLSPLGEWLSIFSSGRPEILEYRRLAERMAGKPLLKEYLAKFG